MAKTRFASKPKKQSQELICCTPMELPEHLHEDAAKQAVAINPANAPARVMNTLLEPQHLSLLTAKYWGAKGVDLTVGFMEQVAADLRDRILAHMNAWSAYANVTFRWTQTSPAVRISLGSGGYWSYLGTDILSIPANQPTMNLQGFTMSTPESEYRRVVRHETGHTLGFPHEHMRQDLVALLDPQKTIAYFMKTQGWSAKTVQQQILTPLAESALLDPTKADAQSIMCYSVPGQCTKNGQPILGGLDIDELDKAYIAKLYPKAAPPVNPPAPPVNPPSPPVSGKLTVTLSIDAASKTASVLSVV